MYMASQQFQESAMILQVSQAQGLTDTYCKNPLHIDEVPRWPGA